MPATCGIDFINLFGKKKADVKKSSHMTDGIYSMVVQFSSRLFAGQSRQNVHLVVFVHLQAHALQFFSPLLSCLSSNKMLFASLDFKGLVSPLLSRNLLRSHNLFLLEQAIYL